MSIHDTASTKLVGEAILLLSRKMLHLDGTSCRRRTMKLQWLAASLLVPEIKGNIVKKWQQSRLHTG